MNDDREKDRYQNQKWWVRLWRRRHYLTIPYWSVRSYLLQGDKPAHWHLSLRNCWSISIGVAQGKMNWYHTWKEMQEKYGWKDLNEK